VVALREELRMSTLPWLTERMRRAGHDMNVERLGREGFRQEGAHLELALQPLDLVRVLDDPAHHDDREVLSRLALPDPSADLIAVHSGEPEIDEQEVIGCSRKGFESSTAIRSNVSIQAFVQKVMLDDGGKLFVVFNNKDLRHVRDSQNFTVPLYIYKKKREEMNGTLGIRKQQGMVGSKGLMGILPNSAARSPKRRDQKRQQKKMITPRAFPDASL
jgi:hypothetical protein